MNASERAGVSRLGLGVIVALYLAHALPLYFYNVALPAILRSQGVDLRWIGMLSLLYLPWAFKFLWAPMVDRHYLPALGRRRTWLWLTQAALVVGVLALAFIGLDHGLLLFVLVGLWISTVAATQDIAIDGHTVEALAPGEHRLGSMAQSMGVALGSMIGGAGVLWLYDAHGWTTALLTLAGLTLLPMFAVARIDDHARPAAGTQPSFLQTFRQAPMRQAMLLIVLYRVVEAPAMAMLTPLLVDQRWSLPQIGLLISVAGAAAGLLASVVAARKLARTSPEQMLWRAGWWRTGLYLLLAMALLIGQATVSQWLLGSLVVAFLALRYFVMTGLYALFMRLCSRDQAGTDFTVLVCFELLVFFIGGSLSGFLAQAVGFSSYYFLLCAISALGVLSCRPLLRRLAGTSVPTRTSMTE